MDKVSGKLTVFFEEPFWIGVFERVTDGKLSVCKVVFGAEGRAQTGAKYRSGYKIATDFTITAGADENQTKNYEPGATEAEKKQRFELKQQKKKEKHRGR